MKNNVDANIYQSSINSYKRPLILVILTIAVFFISQIFAGMMLVFFASLRNMNAQSTSNWISSSIYAQFFFVLLAEGINLIFVYLYFRKNKINFSLIGLRKPKLSDVYHSLIVLPVYYGSYFIMVLAITFFYKGLNVNQAQQIGFNSVRGPLELILTFIALVVLPPITEEILVRGVIYSALKQKMKPYLAVIITSLLFASAHLPEGGKAGLLWIGAIDTFILSLFLIYLREKTNGLFASILLHALKNGVAFYYLFLIH